MATLHLHLPESSEPCGYLAGQEARLEYRYMTDVTPDEAERMMERGWRRFGMCFFRPRCLGCMECVSLRIPIEEFRPNKSQRRAMRKCSELRVEARRPVADEERLELKMAWHGMREETRGWKKTQMSLEDYHATFCTPHACAWELDYFLGDRLVGVGFVDETPNAMSSVYFFYHPEVRHMSLGVASVLFELNLARQRGRSHLYLGYRVAACGSTAYKSQFHPHELLLDRPEMDEPARWVASRAGAV